MVSLPPPHEARKNSKVNPLAKKTATRFVIDSPL
jgi:hypothetical protein